MNAQYKRWLTWIPRLLTVAFVGFLALFAMDVFSEYDNLRDTLVALFMHLIPNFILLIALLIAWRYKIVGGVIFLILGVISVFAFGTYAHIITFLIVSLPAYIIGLLFILDGFFDRNEPQTVR